MREHCDFRIGSTIEFQNRRFGKRYPNGRFLIWNRTFRQAPANDHFWPQSAVGQSCTPSAGIDPFRPFTLASANDGYGITKRPLNCSDQLSS